MARFRRQHEQNADVARAPRDLELAQAITRVGVTVTAVLYCLVTGLLIHRAALAQIPAIALYLGYATLHLAWVFAQPGRPAFRRTLGIFGDQAACTATLLIGAEHALPAFVVYIWVSVGNGMRFGARSMYIATAMAVAGFAVVVLYHGPEVMDPHFTASVFIALVAIPVFVRRLFRQLEQANELLQQQARELQFEASHDRLTGLANRAVFFESLERVIARCDRQQGKCAVIYFDIDGFKSINDNYGHLVGDRWLQSVATAVSSRIRKGDLFCRLAGDEFVILTEHDTSAEAALRIAEAIAASVRATDCVDGHAVEASASVGIALYPSPAGRETATALANRADVAMYCSKRTGRGRCTMHTPGLAFAAAARSPAESREPALSDAPT